MYFIRCFCLRKSQSLRKIDSARNNFVLRQGQKMLDNDLDIVNYLKMVKGFRLMRQVLFNQDQLLLLKFQKADVVNTEPESSSLSEMEKSEYVSIEGAEALTKSVRESAKSEIKRALQKFMGKKIKSRKDFRILQGILSKRYKALETKKERQEHLKTNKLELKKQIENSKAMYKNGLQPTKPQKSSKLLDTCSLDDSEELEVYTPMRATMPQSKTYHQNKTPLTISEQTKAADNQDQKSFRADILNNCSK